jgi:Uma2 family endonuclease
MGATAKSPGVFPGVAFILLNGGMTDEQFYDFCLLNPELRIERANQYVIIMPPKGSETGNKNFKFSGELYLWNRQHKLGVGFDSSTGFKLPTGSDRSPDVAWIQQERWDALPEEMRQRFAPISPDFVVEIRSGDQEMVILKDKMEEYIESGCRLGWLVDPKNRKTMVYSDNGDIQTIPFDEVLPGGEVLPGFEIKMADIF